MLVYMSRSYDRKRGLTGVPPVMKGGHGGNLFPQTNIALSNKNVLDLVDHKANVILYPDLHKYTDIDQILYPHDACFLLYEIESGYGHWCAVLKIANDTIHFFDPYGKFPDSQLKWISEPFKTISNQNHSYLLQLMYKSKYKLTYNTQQFQKYGNNIKDCGRWCSIRILCKDLTPQQFTHLFKSKYGDDLVTLLTIN